MCEAAEVGGDLREAGETEDADGGVAEGREVLGAVAAFHSAVVFVVNHVADPMETVFDAPMSAPGVEQSRGVCTCAGDAGDGELDFNRRLAAADRRPFQATNLGQAWPIEMGRQTRAGFEMPLRMATVAFVAGARFRQRALPLGLARRGKNRAETRPRWLPSTPAGCLSRRTDSRRRSR